MPRHTRTPHLTWEQISLLPRCLVTAELTVHLDAQRNEMQVAWRLRETDTETVIGMEVGTPAGNMMDGLRVTRAARMLHERAVGSLTPF